ncbi:Aste57867_1090 [Aphanomyces stellatus]|uniref:Aste57867_1090 protein n=1 Tax=Aphanomyces stellatus TaxID=120398 RepID=A0A485K4J2_9STRA|nr:hypothetical protein As57867_001089 [Aphanomyces stellatus]VFT78312.1 Aste57867_1090 [Aphanomyces stellatus]
MDETAAFQTATAHFETELDFFLRLVNCRRSRRGDWDSSILEHSQLHLTVPDAIECATWTATTSTLAVSVNLENSTTVLPHLEDLFIFLPVDAPPFCYASADASHSAAAIADTLTSKMQSNEFLALTLLHAIDQAIKQSPSDVDVSVDARRAAAEMRILNQVETNAMSCDVLMCLLVAAACSPKGLRPAPPRFRIGISDVDLDSVNTAIDTVPPPSTLTLSNDILCVPLQALPLPTLYLLDWLWCRVPISLQQVDVSEHLPGLALSDICFAGRVVQSENPWFDRMAKTHGSKLCFHGSRLASFHSIVQNGLHVMSGTRHMSSGNVFGDGIYFAESIQVAANFASTSPSTWAKSHVLSKSAICVAVCQVICNPNAMTHLPSSSQGDGAYYIVHDERFVRLQYLIFSQPHLPPSHAQDPIWFGSWRDILVSVALFLSAFGMWRYL